MSEPQAGAEPQSQSPAQTSAGLPDKIPDGWLEQIRALLRSEKPKVWAAILGSSLLATAVGSGVSYVIAMKQIASGKSQVQREIQKEWVRSRQAAYTKLAQSLNVFVMNLEGFVDLVQIAHRSPINVETTNRIQEQLRAAGRAGRDVITARKDPILSGFELGKELDDCMRELTPALADAEQNPQRSLPRIGSGKERLQQLISRIQDQIPKEVENIH